eukprot:6172257-Pleurochrysis_carterae.AAC.1
MWRGDAPILSKLETVKSFSSPENRDGCASATHIDQWLKKQSTLFKSIQLTSHLKCRDWCSTGQFTKNVATVTRAAELSLRRASKSNNGGRQIGNESSAAGAAQNKTAELAQLNIGLQALKEAEAQLLLAAPFYSGALGTRLVHVELEPHEEGLEMPCELVEAILRRNITGPYAKQLFEIIKKGELAAMVSKGSAGDFMAASPMFSKSLSTAQAPSTADDLDEEPNLFGHPIHNLGNTEENVDEEDGEEGYDEAEELKENEGSKAKKVARRSIRAKNAIEKAASVAPAAAPAAAAIDVTGSAPAPAEEQRKKREYKRTGMYSRDAETAALARTKHGKQPLCTPAAASSSLGTHIV